MEDGIILFSVVLLLLNEAKWKFLHQLSESDCWNNSKETIACFVNRKIYLSCLTKRICQIKIRGHSKSMFAQDSQVLTPHPTLPFFAHVRFRAWLSVMNFQVQIYWKDQKTERLKKMQSFFHSKVFKQGSLH